MSTQEANKELVRRFYELLDTGNQTAAYDLLASSYRVHVAGQPTAEDLERYKLAGAALYVAFPDLYHTIEEMVAEGDRVAIRLVAHGTNAGNFFGMPPSGKTVTVPEIAIFRIAEGKIAEQWTQSDALGMMQQLGILAIRPVSTTP